MVYCGQQSIIISGAVKDGVTKVPIDNAILRIEGLAEEFFADDNGIFNIKTEQKGELILIVLSSDYLPKRIPIFLDNNGINLGEIYLDQDFTLDKTDNLITLTETDISNDGETIIGSSGLLQATRDNFFESGGI